MNAKISKSSITSNTGVTPPLLDTLAQLGSNDKNPCHKSDADDDIKFDATTSIADKKSLLKRARRKYFSSNFSLRLVDASKNNIRSVLKKSYWNTFHCARQLQVCADGSVKGHYCKNRWCLVCNSIRTARLIRTYQPILDGWEDKYMVTLTVPNCKGLDLKHSLEYMYYYFTQCKNTFKCRKVKFVGVRKLECTYNAVTNEYHPHFHVIVRKKEVADALVDEWLKRIKYATRAAQDVREANTGSSMELFKYFSKVISKTGKSADGKAKSTVYADAQDMIFNAVRRKRVFQPFGFKVSADDSDDKEDEEVTLSEVIAIAEWDTDFHDWFRDDTGEALTGYNPSDGFKELVTKRIISRPDYQGN